MVFFLEVAVASLSRLIHKLNYTYYILKYRMIACIPRRLFCSWSDRSTRMFRTTQTKEQSSKYSSLAYVFSLSNIHHVQNTDLQIWNCMLIIVFNLVHAGHLILYYLSRGFPKQQEKTRRCRKPRLISNFVLKID